MLDRPVLCFCELSYDEQQEVIKVYGYNDGAIEGHRFFRAYGQVWDLSEFLNMDDPHWDAGMHLTNTGGMYIKLSSDAETITDVYMG